MRDLQTTFPLLFIFLFFILLNVCPSHADDSDLELLLSFKSSIKNPSNILSNWNNDINNSSLSFCKWHGITCNNFSRVNTVQLSGQNLSGEISPSLFRLPFIESLDLSNNQFLGKLPHAIFSSASSSSSSLRYLNLSNNNLTGPLLLPSGPGYELEALDLSNNMLSGKIPENIGSFFSSLKFLDLGGNLLVGKIPTSISNLTALEYLTLASNQLVGPIPRNLGQIKSLKFVYFGYNNLSGEIPEDIGRLNSLYHLDLVYNKLTGQIPNSVGNLTELQYLFLYQNKLSGSIPRSVFGLKNLVSLDLSDNSLSGDIPEHVSQLQKLEILHIFVNNLTGKIPQALSSLPRLRVLQLWSNKLSGQIPAQLGRRNNLTVLDLSTNHLTGKIPDGLCGSGFLFKLILFSNSLQGELPKSLTSCKSLSRVRIQNNRISGELPPEIMKLPELNYLDISGNNFSGRVNLQKWDMPSLQMLRLARNRFSGNLPDDFGSNNLENSDLSENEFSGPIRLHSGSNLSELMQLNLSHNKLTGPIPEELSSCKKLVSLDLSYNRLTGQIPVSLASMQVLSLLDLSENYLSGQIPPSLGQAESLVQVNISHNHLHGSLPSAGAFIAINASALSGNDLCGGDSTSGLPPCEKRKRKNTSVWWFVITVLISSLTAFVVASSVIVFVRRRKNQFELKRVENEEGVWQAQFFDSKFSSFVTVHDILSSVKEENIISRGRNEGIWYLGTKSTRNDVVQFVLKETNSTPGGNPIPENFWSSEIAEYGRLVSHRNVVKLLGIGRSEKVGYLIYEHVEGKYLSEIVVSLSWERRRTIALGIARGIRFLHRQCSPSLIATHLSPDKIIVTVKDEPRLRLCVPDHPKCFTSSPYAPPEIKKGKEISEKSNVYSFGLILIELLTGKGPADQEFCDQAAGIVEWASYCYSDCHLDMWVDQMIRCDVSNSQSKIIVDIMNLALHCTAADPMARPSANDVFKTLESLTKKSSCAQASSRFLSNY